MKRTLALVAGAALLAVAAFAVPAGADPDQAAMAAAATIRLKDSYMSPSSRTVARGGTVRFLWAGERPHNLTVRVSHAPTARRGFARSRSRVRFTRRAGTPTSARSTRG